jgi:hypothetical protein
MLPLVGQRPAQHDSRQGTALVSPCIVGARIAMVPMAALVGARLDRWGRSNQAAARQPCQVGQVHRTDPVPQTWPKFLIRPAAWRARRGGGTCSRDSVIAS